MTTTINTNAIISNYTDGSLYFNRSAFKASGTIENAAPSYPIFALAKSGNEEVVYDVRKFNHTNQQRLIDALNSGIITGLDKSLLSLVATFSAVAITSKMISELLVLMGSTSDRADVDKSVHRLWSYGLVDFYHFQDLGTGKKCVTRMLSLTPTGFRLVKSLGLKVFYYNAIDFAGRSVADHKRNAAGSQALITWLKHQPVTAFALRKTVLDFVDQDKEAIVRPTVTITAEKGGDTETLYFEVVRRIADYKEDFKNKLSRYNRVFSHMETKPTLVIVGEDEEHTRELYNYLTMQGINTQELVFTHDLAVASDQDFDKAFYCYENGVRIQLHIA